MTGPFPAPPAPTYAQAIAELGDILVLGFLSIAAADRRDYLVGMFGRVRVGLELRLDWTPAERAKAIVDLGDSVALRLSTIVETIEGRVGRA